MDARLVVTQVTRALAEAHAALDGESSRGVVEARRQAIELLAKTRSGQPATLTEAREILTLLDQLRGLVGLLEVKLLRAPVALRQ